MKIININSDWLFVKDTKEIPNAEVGEKINLPHTWNAIDGMDGGSDFFRGSCVYTKVLKASELEKEGKCIYRLDETNTLNLASILVVVKISEDNLLFEYDLYNPNDMVNPITRNKVEINCEVESLC